jgi:hypothetical protein
MSGERGRPLSSRFVQQSLAQTALDSLRLGPDAEIIGLPRLSTERVVGVGTLAKVHAVGSAA